MSGLNYPALAATAKKLITANGQPVTFKAKSRGSYNPAAGHTSQTASTYTAQVVMLDTPKAEQTEETKQFEIQNAIADSVTEPSISDTATINGRNYRVLSVTKIQPSTTVIYYELQLAS